MLVTAFPVAAKYGGHSHNAQQAMSGLPHHGGTKTDPLYLNAFNVAHRTALPRCMCKFSSCTARNSELAAASSRHGAKVQTQCGVGDEAGIASLKCSMAPLSPAAGGMC